MRDKIIGYTTGVYDMFHVGHLRLLKNAKIYCDHLIVGISSDKLVQKYKSKMPIIPLDHRMEIVSSISFVDEVVIQHDRDKFKAFEKIKYNLLFVGDDWKGDPFWDELEKKLKMNNSHIMYLPYTKNISSTRFTKILEELE